MFFSMSHLFFFGPAINLSLLKKKKKKTAVVHHGRIERGEKEHQLNLEGLGCFPGRSHIQDETFA